jgi:hypothetical protein
VIRKPLARAERLPVGLAPCLRCGDMTDRLLSTQVGIHSACEGLREEPLVTSSSPVPVGKPPVRMSPFFYPTAGKSSQVAGPRVLRLPAVAAAESGRSVTDKSGQILAGACRR